MKNTVLFISVLLLLSCNSKEEIHPKRETIKELVFASVRKHGKVLVLTEEQLNNSFAEALSLRISNSCYHFLDAKVEVMGALNLPAVPINLALEAAMLPTAEKVAKRIQKLLSY